MDERIVDHWLDLAPQEAGAAGESVERLRAATAAEAPRSVERARGLGERFARLVG